MIIGDTCGWFDSCLSMSVVVLSSDLSSFLAIPFFPSSVPKCEVCVTSPDKLSGFELVSSCTLSEKDENVSLRFLKENSAAHGSGEGCRNIEEVLERGSGFNPGEVAALLGQASGLALPDPSCLEVDCGC